MIMHLSHPPSLELLRQQQTLKDLEKGLANQKIWIQRRNDIEKSIELLKEDIQIVLLSMHQSKNDEKEKKLQNEFNQKKESLKRLKNEQHQLDEWLDHVEDLTEDDLIQCRLQLLQSIWQEYPLLRDEQETKWNRLKQLTLIELELAGIGKILERIRGHIQIAIQARESIKGIGILNYIFGTSPNVVIEKQLKEIDNLANDSAPFFQRILKNELTEPLRLMIVELLQWLNELKKKCQQSWNFKFIDKLFNEVKSRLAYFEQEMTSCKNQITLEINHLNKEMNQWLTIV